MKKSEKNKKDKDFFQKVRDRGSCEMCGSSRSLQAAHFYSRRYIKLRWHDDNVFCLCFACHKWGHDNPALFSKWVLKELGKERYNNLMKIRNSISKFPWEI